MADLHSSYGPRTENHVAAAPIERQVFEGQTLTVQVIKDPIGTKGARLLSTQISIAGRLLVYLPQDTHIGISQKIGSPELRDQLRVRLLALLGRGSDGEVLPNGGDAGGGFILRTNGEEATDAELAEDIAYLRRTGQQIREKAYVSPAGTLLHQDLSLAERVLRDLATEATQTIRIDSKHAVRCAEGVRRSVHPGFQPQARTLPRRAADL